MLEDLLLFFIVFGLPIALIFGLYLYRHRKQTQVAQSRLQESLEAGLHEPASLHPVIDPARCLGCGSCVAACPEGDVLGLVKRKAVLVAPSECIGHGACKDACPANAITLVFGTETRGVEIPVLSPTFETSVPGISIAGELGGMGLIKNAISQGQQAVESIASGLRRGGKNTDYDLIIVGAGPAGLAAALTAKSKKLRYRVLEQDTIGGTVAHYPRGKVVMTRPAVLPLVGKFQFREASKERLVSFWQDVVSKAALDITTGTQVINISGEQDNFRVHTVDSDYTCARVLLALGRRGTPRKLGVPGEELDKVVYRLIDPEQYAGKNVLVVGGGDSALEAALAVAAQPGTSVTLSYRSDAFSRAKAKNRANVEAARAQHQLRVMMRSQVVSIMPGHVSIEDEEREEVIANDAIIVCAGGILPTPFLKQVGIHVEEKFGQA